MGREAEDLERERPEGDGVGWLTLMRSMRSRRRSCSRSADAPDEACFLRSMDASSCPPSSRRLLTKVSTFFWRFSTVSFISE